ncbi:MAG TPA: DinB family protein [Gemmatimonadaceae bacterium]|jgi:hypothetical protein
MAAKKKSARGAPAWRKVVAKAVDWEEGHASLEKSAHGLAQNLRGRRPDGAPHSAWELLDHIRRTQADLLDFMTNKTYVAPNWPTDYWPTPMEEPSASAWSKCLAQITDDRAKIKRLATRGAIDLTAEIPWGKGKTYLRCILVAIDHTSYHVGQLVIVRRLLGAWKS